MGEVLPTVARIRRSSITSVALPGGRHRPHGEIGVFCITPNRYIPHFKGVLPADEMGQHYVEFINDMSEVCSSKSQLHEAHMQRLVPPIMAHVAILVRFLKHRNIKWLENRLSGHSAHALLKYPSM